MVSLNSLLASFPTSVYPQLKDNQRAALEFIADKKGTVVLQLPTGTGKTAIGYTVLKAISEETVGTCFYIVPTKTLVDQVKLLHPDLTTVYGRNEYDCLYYPGEKLAADEIPCSLLVDCAHRVTQQSGETFEPGAVACPYLWAKYRAKQSRIVVCTMAFYLFTQLFSKEWEEPAGLVIDEAHRISQVVRNALSFDITDYHLSRAVKLLRDLGTTQADNLEGFLNSLLKVVKNKRPEFKELLTDQEIQDLVEALAQVDGGEIKRVVGDAIAAGKIDLLESREVLVKVERLIFDLKRYLRAFQFSLPTDQREPLNYMYAYYVNEIGEHKKVQHRLVVKSYYVVPLIQRILSDQLTLAYSATISNPGVFGYETGLKGDYLSLPSDFPISNTRVFLPTDVADLSMKKRGKREPNKTMRLVARACRQFADKGIRSLVVLVSEAERTQFARISKEEKVDAISYGNGIAAKDAAYQFKAGLGKVLYGTDAQYGEGVDLPRGLAPVIFILRPPYPSPVDPMVKFEERRFGKRRWAIWNWRVMLQALQVRGRNIRSEEDIGVTFFMSMQFKDFLYATLPDWLKPAYQGKKSFDQCIEEALTVLNS